MNGSVFIVFEKCEVYAVAATRELAESLCIDLARSRGCDLTKPEYMYVIGQKTYVNLGTFEDVIRRNDSDLFYWREYSVQEF